MNKTITISVVKAPEVLKAVEQSARENGRSVSAEIMLKLRSAYRQEGRIK